MWNWPAPSSPTKRYNCWSEPRPSSPDSPLIASELGRVYLSSGEPGKALAEFGRALAIAPDNPQALVTAVSLY